MTREDRVLALFAAANPVPDADALMLDRDNVVHLGTAEQMESTMADTQRGKTEPTETRRDRRPWLTGAAAAVIVLLVGAGLWALTSRGNEDVATSPPDTTAQVAPEVAAVLSAIDAYNAGDVDGWVAAFDPAAEDVQTEPWGGTSSRSS